MFKCKLQHTYKLLSKKDVNGFALPKALRTRGLSSAYQSNFFSVISQVQTQILIKFHLQNTDQATTSKSRPNINITTKLKIQNIDQTKLQNLDQYST